jgi:hypothetical protein
LDLKREQSDHLSERYDVVGIKLENKKHMCYNILDKKVKQFLVKQTEFLPISKVAKMYDVSINNLCRWKKSCERKAGAGRKVTDLSL